jgi:microcystin-dependent protein
MLPHITAAMIDNWNIFHNIRLGTFMLKRLALGLLALACATVAHAAGTVPGFSLTPQFDLTGVVMPGCKLYIIQAGTTSTPQNAYQDSALTLLFPNPLTCDAAGRLPQWFVADGLIKVRLTKSNGSQVFSQDSLLVVGASSGGGGGGTVDPTTISATGDVKSVYGTGAISGWVRMNGRTIGSATSGATERANADTSALFAYLWSADANLAVSGGRGANAAADYASNKTITLPDARGRILASLDDMGNSAAGRLTATYFGASGGCSGALGTTLGAACGSESHLLITSEMPSHNHGVTDPGHTHNYSSPGSTTTGAGVVGNFGGTPVPTQTGIANTGISIQNTGGGGSHAVVQPTILVTTYIKL